MPLYTYQAFSRDGKKSRGTIDAGSVAQVREELGRKGLYVITVEQVEQAAASQSWLSRFFKKKITRKEVIFFTKQLSILLKSGVPLLDALGLLVEQTEGALRSVVSSLRDYIKEGKSLADGLGNYPEAFDVTYVQLVKAGEASGKLELILDRLTGNLERAEALNKKIRGALSYPLIQLSVIVLVVIVLLTYVVPQITESFSEQGAQLPTSTAILIAISNALRNYYLLWIIAIIAIIVIFRAIKASKQGSYMLDVIKLKIPIVNYFSRMGAVVQFSRTLGMLLEGGVNLAESLDIVCNIVGNQVLVRELNAARENIIKQGRVAEYLKRTGLFPPMAIYLINTGEQSGELHTMLNSVAQTYEDETSEFADALSSKIDPIMLIFMAVIVGFILISILTPMMQQNEMLTR